MRVRHIRLLALGCAGILALAVPPLTAHADAAGDLPTRARAQIEALAEAKAQRSPADNKLDSSLLTAAQLDAGRALPGGVHVAAPVALDQVGRTTVDIRTTGTADLARRVKTLGGVVRHSSAADGTVRAELPLAAVRPLSELPQVSRISSVAAGAQMARIGAPAPLSKEQRAAVLQERLSTALAAPSARSRTTSRSAVSQGPVVSEGDVAMSADLGRARRNVSGVGITVAVLSDGVDSLSNSIATGELPPDTRALPGTAGAGDEGTAMLEIVHDLAPNAHLLFATAFNGADSFADNIRALRAAGADVIVDDTIYLNESPFQDGPIAQAVLDVTNDGAVYVSSAGNEGNVDDGTSGNYEGDFRASSQHIGDLAGTAHDFDPGTGVQLVDPMSAQSVHVPILLQWADPLGHATDDYDVYSVDPAGNVVGFSNTRQDGDDDPFEAFYNEFSPGARLVVVKYSGADRYFQLTAFRGRFSDSGAVKAYASPGVTRGHSAVPAALSVAAAPAAAPFPYDLEPGDPAAPAGPYPGRYARGQVAERFSSDGPRRVFFTPAGVPLTPGNFSSTGGQVRRKPELTGADGVSTSAPGYESFFGTSAAAPHIAALAALALSGHPGLDTNALRTAMARSAVDLERSGIDRDTGHGVVDALAMLRSVQATGQPYAVAGPPVVAGSADGDTYLESGERATVSVPVQSTGDVTAHNIRVRLRSTTPGVRVTAGPRTYGTLPSGRTASRNFTVTAPSSLPAGTRLALTATVRFRGSLSPQVATSTLLVGQPSTTVVDVPYPGPATPIPDASADGVSVPLVVSGVGPINHLTFSIDGSACSTTEASPTVGIDHTFVGDLVGTLATPDGTVVQLFSNVGGEGHNFCQTVFDDAASAPIQDAFSVQAPFSGRFIPQQPLAGLDGHSADGTWHFTVADLAGNDTGTIRAFSLHLTGYAAPPAPSRGQSGRR